MVRLNCSTTAAAELNCKSSCNKENTPGKENSKDTDPNKCGPDTDIASTSYIFEKDRVCCQDGNLDQHGSDKEKGWSIVGPRKQKKKKNRK